MKIIDLLAATTQVPHDPDMDLPLWKELWLYFYESYYVNNVYYGNLGMDTSDMIAVKNLILGLFIGIALASFAVVYNKRVLGGFVRKLLRAEAFSPDSALTLSELGAKKNPFIRHAVRKSVSLRRVVRCPEEEEFIRELNEKREAYDERTKDMKLSEKMKKANRFKEEKFEIDLESDRFYIPEDMKYTAEIKFNAKGTSLIGAIVFVIVLAIVFVALIVSLPRIFEILNDFAAMFADKGNDKIL